MGDLPIIQKTYDLVKWYIPILSRLPRDHKFVLGDRMISGLYDFLEALNIVISDSEINVNVRSTYSNEKEED